MIGRRVLEEAKLAAAGALRGVLVDRVGLVTDDLVEFDATEEVLVGLGHLTQERDRASCSGCRSRRGEPVP